MATEKKPLSKKNETEDEAKEIDKGGTESKKGAQLTKH